MMRWIRLNLRIGSTVVCLRVIAAALFLCLLGSTSAALRAQNPAQGTEASPAQKYFTDVEMVNQDGQTMRLYSDVLKGKVVIINPFFATCTSVCPAMTRNLELLQESLGDALGKRVFIISITVDPATDTPDKLKAY